MESVPLLGKMAAKVIDETHTGPRCSNWSISGRLSYDRINELDKKLAESDEVLTFLFVGGENAYESMKFAWDDEVDDDGVVMSRHCLLKGYDFRAHVWDSVEAEPAIPVKVTEANADLVDGSQVPSKRKHQDHGIEKRQRTLLSERVPGGQGSSFNDDMKAFLKGFVEASMARLETRLDEKFEASMASLKTRLEKKIDDHMSQIKDRISQLTSALSASNAATTSTTVVAPARRSVRMNIIK